MVGQEAPALRQSHGMRIHAFDVADLCARDGDQIVPDAYQRLPHHLHIMMKQQVEVFQHRPGQAVLNGDRDGVGSARVERRKHFRRERTGDNLRIRHQLQRRLVAERARLSLNGNLHAVSFFANI